jgi:hypothetical protein
MGRNLFLFQAVLVLFTLQSPVRGVSGEGQDRARDEAINLTKSMLMEKSMKTKTNCLFGGALLGAGLCAGAGSSALAGDFVWGSASLTAYAYQVSDYATTGGNVSVSVVDVNGASADATFNASGFSMMAVGSPYSYAGALLTTGLAFTVSEDITVLFEWDMTGNNSSFGDGGSLSAFDSGSMSNVSLFSFSGIDVGSSTITLLAGTQYTLTGYVVSEAGQGASSFSVSVVPLPPAAFAGLGMLAGMGAYKRVRRAK